jgi:hypothetical protein
LTGASGARQEAYAPVLDAYKSIIFVAKDIFNLICIGSAFYTSMAQNSMLKYGKHETR